MPTTQGSETMRQIERSEPTRDNLAIRLAKPEDSAAILEIVRPVIRAGETYALDRDMSEDAILDFWLGSDRRTYVVEDGDDIVGTYYLKRNQGGGGAHVANCGYVTRANASGRGIARTMAEHSFETAKALGFKAMQYNCVVSTNLNAIRLWERLGFKTVGRLPGAFEHPEQGYVDALVMFRAL